MKRILLYILSAFFAFPAVAQETEIIAPFLPAQEKTAPAQAPITVQYPHENMTVTRGAKQIFLFGQVNLPPPVSLTVNAVEVPVAANGGFIAYLPVESGGTFTFTLVATNGTETARAVRHVVVPGANARQFAEKAELDPEEIFPQRPVEVLPGDGVDLYARGTPGAHVTVTLSGIKEAKKLPMQEDKNYPGVYRAHFQILQEQKPKTAKVVYTMKDGPKKSSAKKTAPAKLTVLDPKAPLRQAQVLLDGVKLRKLPTAQGNLYPFYRAYGQMRVSGRLNNQYRLVLNETETAWLEMERLQIKKNETYRPNHIHGVNLLVFPDKTRLVLEGLRAVPIYVHEYSDHLELRLYYTDGLDENLSIDAQSPLVGRMEYSQPDEDTLALNLYFKEGARPWGHAYDFEDGNLLVDIVHKPQLPANEKKPLTGARIVLDAGHSPRRQAPYDGAVGPTGYLEYEANLALAEKVQALLEKQGATVIMTRHDSNQMSLQDRYQLALEQQAHIFVSLHYNALPETVDPFAGPRGFTVYYNYPHSFELARAVYQSFADQVPLPDNGMIANDVLFIPRIAQFPSILVENAYLILPEQEEMARSEEGQKLFAKAVYEGILNFYGVKPYEPPAKPARKKGAQKPAKQMKQTYLRAAKPPVLKGK